MKILSEFPITDFQIEIRPKMTPYGQISWPFRVCLVDPSRSRGNCGNIKSWFQSNIFQAMRTVLTNYCDTKKTKPRDNTTWLMWHESCYHDFTRENICKYFVSLAFERDMIYQIFHIIDLDLDLDRSMKFNVFEWFWSWNINHPYPIE